MPSQLFKLRGNQRLSDALLDSLGDLEGRVIVELRRLGEANVNSVNNALGACHAYTTVMTTMDRLYKKGLLDRRKRGRAYYYRPKYSVEQMEQGLAADVIDRLLAAVHGPVEPVLAFLVESVSERDRRLLDELEKLVREKQKALECEAADEK